MEYHVKAQEKLIQESIELYRTIVTKIKKEDQEANLEMMFEYKMEDFAYLFGIRYIEHVIDLAKTWYEESIQVPVGQS